MLPTRGLRRSAVESSSSTGPSGLVIIDEDVREGPEGRADVVGGGYGTDFLLLDEDSAELLDSGAPMTGSVIRGNKRLGEVDVVPV